MLHEDSDGDVSYVGTLRRLVGTTRLHVPGVRAILLNAVGDVLLQRRTDMPCWGLPAGAIELGETAFAALRREVLEETGLCVIAAEPMALHSGRSQQFTYPNGDRIQGFAVSFIVRDWTGVPLADGVEGSDVRFWPVDALPSGMVPLHAQTLVDFKTYNGHFLLT